MQRRIKSKVVIYGAWCICHPDRGIYYVGQTIRGVVSRWTTHLWCSRTEHSKSYNSRLSRWIRKHGPDNVAFSVLEVCTPDEIDSRERAWISDLRKLGQAQANYLEGGAQPRGHKNPEHSAKMSGPGNPMYGRDRKELMAYARSFQGSPSEETRRKMGDAHRGENNSRAILNDEKVREIRRRYTGRYGELTRMGKEFGVTAQMIYSIVNRKSWKHVD